jgi:hypothetical protein
MDSRVTRPGAGAWGVLAADPAHPAAGHGAQATGLAAAAAATHAAALGEFAIGTVESEYKAIARLSVHLAAMRRAVYTPGQCRPAAPAELRAACRVAARRLEWALWLLQGRLAGDMAAVRQSSREIYAHLDRCLGSYLDADRALAAWLDSQLPAGERWRVAEGYLRCLAHAPTRPHPRAAQGRTGYWVAFAFHRRWDRLLDTVDARPGVGRGFLDPAHPAGTPQHCGPGDTQAA